MGQGSPYPRAGSHPHRIPGTSGGAGAGQVGIGGTATEPIVPYTLYDRMYGKIVDALRASVPKWVGVCVRRSPR